MKEELAFKDAVATKANIYRANIEQEMEGVKVPTFILCALAGLYLERSVRGGCNERAGVWETAEPRWGTGGKAPRSYQYVLCNIVPIKTGFGFCASSVCILSVKHALKLKRHTVGLLLGYFRDDVPCWSGSGLGSDEEELSEVRGVHPLWGVCITCSALAKL